MKCLRIIFTAMLFSFGFVCHADEPLYKVEDGYKVDGETMKGFRTWRAAACDRCHGAKDEFVKTVTDGRLEKGMPSFKTSNTVMSNIDHLYAYLKGRSDGAITRSKVEEIK